MSGYVYYGGTLIGLLIWSWVVLHYAVKWDCFGCTVGLLAWVVLLG